MRCFLGKNKVEWLKKTGSIEQLAGIHPVVFDDGKARGIRAFDVRNARLKFTVLVDRGMDIGQVEFEGVPIAWFSPVGYASGHFYESESFGWLRNFTGGLLTTCGMTQIGEPCREGQDAFGLHGRISNLPAFQTGYETYWIEDRYHLSVKGKTRESSVFGEHLEMSREVQTYLGAPLFSVKDIVKNHGFKETPFMYMYHINLGYPLVDEHSFLVCRPKRVWPWDGTKEANIREFYKMPEPSNTIDEEVIHLEVMPSDDGQCYMMLVNPVESIAFYLCWNAQQFTRFSLWKGIHKGIYCLGFEPANCGLNGRVEEINRGTVEFLQPFEERSFETTFGFLSSEEEIRSFIQCHFQSDMETFMKGQYYSNFGGNTQ